MFPATQISALYPAAHFITHPACPCGTILMAMQGAVVSADAVELVLERGATPARIGRSEDIFRHYGRVVAAGRAHQEVSEAQVSQLASAGA